jgi:hypothetical protein
MSCSITHASTHAGTRASTRASACARRARCRLHHTWYHVCCNERTWRWSLETLRSWIIAMDCTVCLPAAVPVTGRLVVDDV